MSARELDTAPACPNCRAVLNGAVDVDNDDDRGPEPGDYGVCLYCATPIVYDGDPLDARPPTADEVREMAEDAMFSSALECVRDLVRVNPRRSPAYRQ